MAETSLVTSLPGFELPPGWAIRSVSVSVPYPDYGRRDLDEMEVRFVHYAPMKTTEADLTFTRAHFDGAWLTAHLNHLAAAPRAIRHGTIWHDHRATY